MLKISWEILGSFQVKISGFYFTASLTTEAEGLRSQECALITSPR